MVARIILAAIISIFIITGFPGYSLAAGEHSGHGGVPANKALESNAGHDPAGMGQGGSAAGHGPTSQNDSGHGGHGPGAQAPDNHLSEKSGHGARDGGSHQEPGKSNLEPVKNELVGGFAGLNALVIAVAAFLKMKALRGGAA
ncbi:MAG: hypothetical protein ACOY40_14750 [Bacillota bacterium]